MMLDFWDGGDTALRRPRGPRSSVAGSKKHPPMRHFLALPRALHADRRGVTALEYALVAGALSGVLVTAFTLLGAEIHASLTAVAALIP